MGRSFVLRFEHEGFGFCFRLTTSLIGAFSSSLLRSLFRG